MINGNRTKSTRGRSPRDFYETPYGLVHTAINDFLFDERILPNKMYCVLDPGCGSGVWGKAIKKSLFGTYVIGVDIEPKIRLPNLAVCDVVHKGDYLTYHTSSTYDFVIGNPPYSLAEPFIRKSFDLLDTRGYVYFLLRLSFLEGIDRSKNLFKEFPIKRVYICSRRPSFFSTSEGKHTTDTLAYAMFLWQKDWVGRTEIDFLDWEYDV